MTADRSGDAAGGILLYLIECEDEQGAVERLASAIDHLARTGAPFRILLSDPGGAIAARIGPSVAVDVLAAPDPDAGVLRTLADLFWYYRKLFRYFLIYRFDAVHAVGLRAACFSVGLKIRFNVPLIWQFWSILSGRIRVRAFQFLASTFCDEVVAGPRFVPPQLRTIYERYTSRAA